VSPFHDVLVDLLRIPGARYCSVVDRESGDVFAELGTSPITPHVVVEWGVSAAKFLAAHPPDHLDDIMITSGQAYHLVRQVAAQSTRPLLIYLCLDRERANLAAARRELAASAVQERLSGTASAAIERETASSAPAVPAALPIPTPRTPNQTQPPAPPEPAPPDPPRTTTPGARSGSDRGEHAVPLPRRTPGATGPPAPPAASPPARPGAAGRGWATDTGTLRRLLAALRALP
jgi:hypothetical protein